MLSSCLIIFKLMISPLALAYRAFDPRRNGKSTDPPHFHRGMAPSYGWDFPTPLFVFTSKLNLGEERFFLFMRVRNSYLPRKQPWSKQNQQLVSNEKSPIGSTVTEILGFRWTDKQTDIHRSTLYYRTVLNLHISLQAL